MKNIKTKSSLVFFCFSLILLLIPRVQAPFVPHEYIFNIPCYAPTKITFNYAYTHNHSISNIQTVGASLYKHSGGPTYLEFIAEDIDTYSFTVELHYKIPQNQTIVIGIWSGNQPMLGVSLFSHFEDVIIYVKLSVTKQPTYPTAEETALAVTQQISKDLADTYQAIKAAIDNQNQAILTNSILSLVSVLAVAVLSTAYYVEIRRRRGLPK